MKEKDIHHITQLIDKINSNSSMKKI